MTVSAQYVQSFLAAERKVDCQSVGWLIQGLAVVTEENFSFDCRRLWITHSQWIISVCCKL